MEGAAPQTDRRRQSEDDYFGGSRRYTDKNGMTIVNVHAGDCFVTNRPDEVGVTVLGSCVSACIRDPERGIGGMNHFLLPNISTDGSASMRSGAYAMEKLINEILKRGGNRSVLEVKVFGGGNVIKSSAMVGTKNADFVRRYLETEGFHIATEDLGGTLPRKIRYYPETGKVMVRKMQRQEDLQKVSQEEVGYQRQITTEVQKPESGDIELF